MTSTGFSGFAPEALKFLRALKRNNNRDWFLAHKEDYEAAVKTPLETLIRALAVDFEKFAPEYVASPRSSIYRIQRDTRFSKDKSPYKTHAAAVFPRKGFGKHQGAGLYFHLSPDEFLVGGGIYMPAPDELRAVRTHILENVGAFKKIVEGEGFRKMFGELWGESLSRAPRGFPAEHAAAEYLKRKQYLAGRTLSSDLALGPSGYKTIVETFRAIMPFIRFLNDPIARAGEKKQRQDALLR